MLLTVVEPFYAS